MTLQIIYDYAAFNPDDQSPDLEDIVSWADGVMGELRKENDILRVQLRLAKDSRKLLLGEIREEFKRKAGTQRSLEYDWAMGVAMGVIDEMEAKL